MVSVSIIIPTLNERAAIAPCLASLPEDHAVEVIVVDGGSCDGTLEVLHRLGHRPLLADPPRARQLNLGAARARGDVLLFLHADSRFPQNGLDALRGALAEPAVIGGAFRIAPDTSHPLVRLIFAAANLRFRWGGIAYGDQGIFVRRAIFREMEGYRLIPLMEDVEFFDRLRRRGRAVAVSPVIRTSARRWQQEGVLRTSARNSLFLLLYRLGVSPDRLSPYYPHVR